jgi:chromate transporter
MVAAGERSRRERRQAVSATMAAGFGGLDWLALFGHFLLMSLLAVGGALATAPDMHRYIVNERSWIGDAEFTASVALAQAAPGPNLIFVPVLGFAVAGLPGAAIALAGMLIPSTMLAIVASRWGAARRERVAVRAFVAGLAPVTIGLLLATSGILLEPVIDRPVAWALVAGTVWLMWCTRLGPIWMILTGAVVGALGGV